MDKNLSSYFHVNLEKVCSVGLDLTVMHDEPVTTRPLEFHTRSKSRYMPLMILGLSLIFTFILYVLTIIWSENVTVDDNPFSSLSIVENWRVAMSQWGVDFIDYMTIVFGITTMIALFETVWQVQGGDRPVGKDNRTPEEWAADIEEHTIHALTLDSQLPDTAPVAAHIPDSPTIYRRLDDQGKQAFRHLAQPASKQLEVLSGEFTDRLFFVIASFGTFIGTTTVGQEIAEATSALDFQMGQFMITIIATILLAFLPWILEKLGGALAARMRQARQLRESAVVVGRDFDADEWDRWIHRCEEYYLAGIRNSRPVATFIADIRVRFGIQLLNLVSIVLYVAHVSLNVSRAFALILIIAVLAGAYATTSGVTYLRHREVVKAITRVSNPKEIHQALRRTPAEFAILLVSGLYTILMGTMIAITGNTDASLQSTMFVLLVLVTMSASTYATYSALTTRPIRKLKELVYAHLGTNEARLIAFLQYQDQIRRSAITSVQEHSEDALR